MSEPKITEDEKKWRAESDARTLAEAEVIKADPKRMQAASESAKRLADEEKTREDAMKKVADMAKEIYPKM